MLKIRLINRLSSCLTLGPLLFFGISTTYSQAGSVQSSCNNTFHEVKVGEATATASSFANLRNSPGSLKHEISRSFEQAKMETKGAVPPEELCKNGCAMSQTPIIYIKSIPLKYLDSYSDKAKCQELYERTRNNPYSYNRDGFSNLDDLFQWMRDLSQGKGSDGKDLYNRCDGDCSPQYDYTIIEGRANQTHATQTTVVCGHARDKSDNNYKLEYGYRFNCS